MLIYLALNALLGLNEFKYFLSIADSRLFMNLVSNERPLAYYQLRQSKLHLPCQQHTASVIHPMNFSVVNKSVLNADKLTLSVIGANGPLNDSQMFAPRPFLVIAA
jgi:hypothetical protein